MEKERTRREARRADDEPGRRELESIKRYVRDTLRKAGKWSPEMSYQVELLASDLLLYRQLRADIMAHGVMVVEMSREGNPRARLRPSVQMLRQQSDAVRSDLRVLLMNRELDPGDAGGGMELLNSLMEADVGDEG